jgi:Ser/Thr protein kinase RdoA (MazF antagonist)
LTTLTSCADIVRLRDILNTCYPVHVDHIHLHRDMIGYVYIAEGATKQGTGKYVLKLYRPNDTENPLRSISILKYLQQQDYPVVSIVPTRMDGSHMVINTPQGKSIDILYDYLDGPEPDLRTEIIDLARQVGLLHQIMELYPHLLIRHGKDFYVDRYLSILQTLGYPSSRISDLAAYGGECWERLEGLPVGFCHGDLHSGNMRQSGPGRYVIFDFDVASCTHPLIDIATLCDRSDFNHFDDLAYERTYKMFEFFYQGYRQVREISTAEIAAIVDFIPVRHYEIIATISQSQGIEVLSRAFLDEQYDWLMRWRNLCEHKDLFH